MFERYGKVSVMKTVKKGSFGFMQALLALGCTPVLLAVIILAIYSVSSMRSELEENVYSRLDACATEVAVWYQWDINEGNLSVDPSIKEDTTFIDSLKSQEIELTLFEGDTRVMTSIADSSNSTGRNIGTKANADIWAQVKNGKDYSGNHVQINGEDYYVYYVPVYDESGSVWGMGFAGEKEASVDSALNKLVRSVVIISVLIFIVLLAVIVFVSKKIIDPLAKITTATQTLSKGDLTEDIEINSFLKETDVLIDAAKVLQDALRSSMSAVTENATALSNAVVEVDNATELNAENVGQINVAINEVAETSQAVAENAQSLSEKATQLGDSIEELSGSVRGLSDDSRKIRKANDEASEYMKTVLSSSIESVEAVENITQEINDTNEAVKAIEACTEMIAEIASETQLLSLNASIEAARAGEAGRGFAVVAQNIKQLAENSSANVEKITEIINKVTELSNRSVKGAEKVKKIIENEQKYITDTQDKFALLSEAVDSSIVEIESLADMTDSLNVIKEEVTNACTDLGAISEETGASAQEVSATCATVAEALAETRARTEEMNAINDNLSGAIAFFKLS